MLYVAIVPEPPRKVIVPTGLKSSVTQRTLPSGRLTFLTCADRRLKPPQPLNCVSSAVAWPLGVRPPIGEPLSDSRTVPPVWHPGGVGVGDGDRERRRPERRRRAEEEPGRPERQPRRNAPRPGVRRRAAGGVE